MTTAGGPESSRERFVAELCSRRRYFLIIFAFAMVFLLIQVPYLFVIEIDSGIGVIVVLNVVGSAAFVIGSGAVLWHCSKRD